MEPLNTAPTYLAFREHPAEGLILKVGRSRNPVRRCQMLGAKLWPHYLATECERDLHTILAEWQVWPRDTRRWRSKPLSGFTEWFYATGEVARRINAYFEEEPREWRG